MLRTSLRLTLHLIVHRVLIAWEEAVLWLIEGFAWRWDVPLRVAMRFQDDWWEIVDRQSARVNQIVMLSPPVVAYEQFPMWTYNDAGKLPLDEEERNVERAIDYHEEQAEMYTQMAQEEYMRSDEAYERLGEISVERSVDRNDSIREALGLNDPLRDPMPLIGAFGTPVNKSVDPDYDCSTNTDLWPLFEEDDIW